VTAKSRRRKRKVMAAPSTRKYKFTTNTTLVIIEAESLHDAKTAFQQRYGYWPEKETTDGSYTTPTEAGTAETTPRAADERISDYEEAARRGEEWQGRYYGREAEVRAEATSDGQTV
jgi:hypothetical protein